MNPFKRPNLEKLPISRKNLIFHRMRPFCPICKNKGMGKSKPPAI